MSGVWHSTYFWGFTSRNILMTSRGSLLMRAMSRPSWTRDPWLRVQGTGIFTTFGCGRSVSIPIAHGSCWGPTSRLKPTVGLGAPPFGTGKWYPHQSQKGYCFDFYTKGRCCQRDQCPYDHGCFKCGKKHPGYTWCNRKKQRKCKPMSTTTAPHFKIDF